MVFDFRFRGVESATDITRLVDFLGKQPLNYRGYGDWLQRAEAELFAEYKQAVLAFNGRVLVGDVVYQAHKQIPRVLEIKNIRVHPDMRRRDFGHFMLKQVEAEAKSSGQYEAVVVDARASQHEVITFLMFSGFKELGKRCLYEENEQDVVMAKPVNEKSGLVRVASLFH